MGTSEVGAVRLEQLRRAVTRLLATLDRIAGALRQLPENSPIRRAIEQKINKWREVANNLLSRPTQEIKDNLKEILGELNSLREYLKKNRSDLIANGHGEEVRALENTEKELKNLAEEFQREVDQRENSSGRRAESPAREAERAPVAPQQPGQQNPSAQAHESMVRGQVLPGQHSTLPSTAQTLQLPSTNLPITPITHTIPVERLVAEIGRNIPVEALVRSFAGEVKTEKTATRIFEIFAQLLVSLIVERLAKELIERTVRTGETSQKEIEDAVKQINAEIARLMTGIKTKADPHIGKERDIERLEQERESEKPREVTRGAVREAPRSAESERITVRVVYDTKGKPVRIEIAGKMRETELAETARQALKEKPVETLPILVETAIRLMEKKPEYRTEILQFVSKTLSQVLPGEIDSVRTMPSPSPSGKLATARAAATSTPAAEAVLEEIINVLIVAPEKSSQILPSGQSVTVVNVKPEARAQREARIEVARAILQNSPETALPVLIKTHARASRVEPQQEAVKQIVAEVTEKLVQTEEGQKYVLAAFAEGKQKPLVSSQTVGHKAIIQTVQNIVAGVAAKNKTRAKTQVQAAAANFSGKSRAEQLTQISQMVASVNSVKLAPMRLTIKTARAFLEFTALAQKCFELMGEKTLVQAEKQAAQVQKEKRRKSTPIELRPATAKKRAAATKPAARQAANPKNIEGRKALRELLRIADEFGFKLPNEIHALIGNHFAAMAGFTGITDNKILSSYQAAQTPAEARNTAVMRRVLEVLEAQMVRPAARGEVPQATARISIQVAVHIVNGIILARVKLDKKRFTEIIEALKRRAGYLSAMVSAIEEVNREGVVAFVDNLVLQAEKRGYTPENLDQILDEIEAAAQAEPAPAPAEHELAIAA